jgi:serine/threonine-protein kinase
MMDGQPPEPRPTPPGPADTQAGGESDDLGATRIVAEPPYDPKAARAAGEAPGGAVVLSSHFGDFRLVRKIGQGAMAAVYLARQPSFDRQVALKVLFKHVAATPKLLERFYREARVLGRLDHPNIVKGYSVGEHAGLHYFAMEFVEGQSLQGWLDRVGRLTVGDAVHVALACARALDYAHRLGVIHRDVKPANVLITTAGVVKVADLGMVKIQDEDLSLTQTGHAVGTPWYMPLEQARNAKETDGRCDIYALGCVLYHMLAGRPPFPGPTLVELFRDKQAGAFPPARQFNPEVPERLDLVIAKMAAKSPRHRHQECAEVVRDLEALGLAGDRLGFPAAPAPAPPAEPTPPPSTDEIPAPAPAAAEWVVRYKRPDGRVRERRLSTDEVLRLIEARKLGPAARASRVGKDDFRALATYREFEHAVLGQAARSGADRQTARYRSLYKKIEEQDRLREEGKAEEPPAGNLVYWAGLALKIGLPVAGLAAVIAFLRWVVQAIQ